MILHTMSSGKSLQLLCILLFGMFCHQYDVCENSVGSVYVRGYGGLSELCPVCFLVVGKGPSVLL